LENLPRETVDHLFIGCPHVRLIVRNICVNGIRTGDFEDKKYLIGDLWTNSIEGITVRCILLHYVKYIIYNLWKQRVMPTLQKVRFECAAILKRLKKIRVWQPHIGNIDMD